MGRRGDFELLRWLDTRHPLSDNGPAVAGGLPGFAALSDQPTFSPLVRTLGTRVSDNAPERADSGVL